MNYSHIENIPDAYHQLVEKSEKIGFTMPSDLLIGTLLKSLICSKPSANVLELGTGIGLSLSWMVAGLDTQSKLTTIDNDPELISIARTFFDDDPRVEIACEDGAQWIRTYTGAPFDLVFADAWPGKYSELDETLDLIKVGGFYVVDDMSEQENWPEGHADKVNWLEAYLCSRKDFSITKMDWSTGVMLCTRVQ